LRGKNAATPLADQNRLSSILVRARAVKFTTGASLA
jgi:hypothetical protein